MQAPDIETCRAGDKIFWQNNEEDGVGEPALLIQTYSDAVTIQQRDSYININYDTIPALVKWLQAAYKEKVKTNEHK